MKLIVMQKTKKLNIIKSKFLFENHYCNTKLLRILYSRILKKSLE